MNVAATRKKSKFLIFPLLTFFSVSALVGVQGCSSGNEGNRSNKNNDNDLVTEPFISRISVNADGQGGNAKNEDPSISADGRYVVFSSLSSNFVDGDTNDNSDVFLRDTVDNTIERISIATDGTQGDGDSVRPTISADGKFVVFQSLASNLVADDTNALEDIFLRDLVNKTTVRVSVGPENVEAVGGGSFRPKVSADGNMVAFYSFAINLIGDGNDTNEVSDVFVRDVANSTTTRVTVSTAGVEANAPSRSPSISDDGFVVGFQSEASNLIDGVTDDDTTDDIFVRNLTNNTTTLVSVADGTTDVGGDGASENPDLSADGNLVVFRSRANNLVTGDSFGLIDMFVRDIANAKTVRVNVDSSGAEATSGSAFRPSISADGRFAVFLTSADNLVDNDTNELIDVFVHELQTGKTIRVNVNSAGQESNDHNIFFQPNISGDGKYVVFLSSASNLVEGDVEMQTDIFRVLVSQTPVNQSPSE